MQDAIRHWKQVIEAAETGVAVIDAHGDFLYQNKVYRALFGTNEHVTNIFQLVRPDALDEMDMLLQDTLSGKTIPLFHAHSQRFDNGAWCDTRVTAHPFFDEEDKPIGCVILVYDITKEVEVQHIKEQLLALSTHDLRTPLTVIRGVTQSLIRRIEHDKLPAKDKLVKELQSVEKSTDRLMRQLDTLVEQFGRGESDEQ